MNVVFCCSLTLILCWCLSLSYLRLPASSSALLSFFRGIKQWETQFTQTHSSWHQSLLKHTRSEEKKSKSVCKCEFVKAKLYILITIVCSIGQQLTPVCLILHSRSIHIYTSQTLYIVVFLLWLCVWWVCSTFCPSLKLKHRSEVTDVQYTCHALWAMVHWWPLTSPHLRPRQMSSWVIALSDPASHLIGCVCEGVCDHNISSLETLL